MYSSVSRQKGSNKTSLNIGNKLHKEKLFKKRKGIIEKDCNEEVKCHYIM